MMKRTACLLSLLATTKGFAPSRRGSSGPVLSVSDRELVTLRVAASDDWFQQRGGESDIAFIKRLTTSSPPEPTASASQVTESPEESAPSTEKKGYQPIEKWEEEQKEKQANMSWEERVQFEGQKFGNQVRQNDILMRQINSGL